MLQRSLEYQTSEVCSKGIYYGKKFLKKCGIRNLGNSRGSGSHWTAWFKNGDEKFYFDSFGAQPPLELEDYLTPPNTEETQSGDQVFCGQLCLYVLRQLMQGKSLQHVINDLHYNTCG